MMKSFIECEKCKIPFKPLEVSRRNNYILFVCPECYMKISIHTSIETINSLLVWVIGDEKMNTFDKVSTICTKCKKEMTVKVEYKNKKHTCDKCKGKENHY
jgi:uncharacterized CHY-type Zn-finger protein